MACLRYGGGKQGRVDQRGKERGFNRERQEKRSREEEEERGSEISFITCFEKDTFFLLKERFLYNARRPKKEHDVREKRGKRRRRGR